MMCHRSVSLFSAQPLNDDLYLCREQSMSKTDCRSESLSSISWEEHSRVTRSALPEKLTEVEQKEAPNNTFPFRFADISA